jgi:DNA-binding XRE family transcriptional regulator
MTQAEFAKTLNQSSHSIVSQWEKKGLKATGMDYNTEIWLRLHMANTLKRADITKYVESFIEEGPFKPKAKPAPIEISYEFAG